MNFAVLLAALLQTAPDRPAQVAAIVEEARCVRVDELRKLYLEIERPPAASSLRPEQHRQVAIFLAACAPPPPIKQNAEPGLILSFAANAGAYQRELDLSRAINTVLSLRSLPEVRALPPGVQEALRRTHTVLFDLQLHRTAVFFGIDWSEKTRTITAKPAAERNAEDSVYLAKLEEWRDTNFLP